MRPWKTERFRVGDWVELKDPDCCSWMQDGAEVISTDYDEEWPIEVRTHDGLLGAFHEDELRLLEKTDD